MIFKIPTRRQRFTQYSLFLWKAFQTDGWNDPWQSW